mmetsp:Transcript_78614/g.218488  ORF Transcript_78614/g.218488 Transcript_78614/m.218488 type:complete len:346 (-) Transcript_78614:35-1072(-)
MLCTRSMVGTSQISGSISGSISRAGGAGAGGAGAGGANAGGSARAGANGRGGDTERSTGAGGAACSAGSGGGNKCACGGANSPMRGACGGANGEANGDGADACVDARVEASADSLPKVAKLQGAHGERLGSAGAESRVSSYWSGRTDNLRPSITMPLNAPIAFCASSGVAYCTIAVFGLVGSSAWCMPMSCTGPTAESRCRKSICVNVGAMLETKRRQPHSVMPAGRLRKSSSTPSKGPLPLPQGLRNARSSLSHGLTATLARDFTLAATSSACWGGTPAKSRWGGCTNLSAWLRSSRCGRSTSKDRGHLCKWCTAEDRERQFASFSVAFTIFTSSWRTDHLLSR